MQQTTRKGIPHQLKIVLLFAGILFLAYLPLSSFLFYLKNDAFLNYFPPKFFMSESINAGHLPLWNPYINYGIPQYADMNAGYWSPITWLIASTVGYNAYTFTLELLFYLFIAGVGVYKLCELWTTDKTARVIAGIAFMCCGYNVGHLQHFNWISAAAFLPWCFWSYNAMLKNFNVKYAILSALCFYMFLSSAHPGLIIGGCYFFFALFVYACLRDHKNKQLQKNSSKLFFVHAVFLTAIALFSAGLISGYTDVLPHFIRGDKLTLGQSLSSPTSLTSWISSILPFATVKNDIVYGTDISMRNCYFSLTLLSFFLLSCFHKKTGWQKFLLITGFLFALLSSGGIFKKVAYDVLPMMGYVRLNGEFRIFALLCFILTGMIELNKFLSGAGITLMRLKLFLSLIGLLILCFTVYGLIMALRTNDSILFSMDAVAAESQTVAKMKMIVDRLSYYDTLWVQGLIQIATLFFMWPALAARKRSMLLTITALNLIITTLLNVPFTGAGKTSVKTFQAVINKSPEGIPIPGLNPIIQNDSLNTFEKKLIGDWNFYNKQIGNLAEYPYPIVLNNMRARYSDTAQTRLMVNKPFLFTHPENGESIHISAFSPNGVSAQVKTKAAGTLIFQQNHYPHWFYKNAGGASTVKSSAAGFISVPVEAGINEVAIFFKPNLVLRMMLLSLLSIALAILFLVYKKLK